ncbi:MAG: hypothetical protein ACK52I_00960 [Pseudomonadota bacterium]|jgi:hypothetical protein
MSTKKSIQEHTAELLLKLSYEGIDISPTQQQEVRSAGFSEELATIKTQQKGYEVEKDEIPDFGEKHLWLYEIPTITEGAKAGEPLEGVCYYDKIPKEWINKWEDADIERSHWRPDSADITDNEFRKFINSHIPQFDSLIPYEPFFLYIEQARRWLEDKRTLADVDPVERYEYKRRELARVADNKLYGLNKYVSIKEDGFIGGRRPYEASTPQALLAFLVDRGNSFDLVKGRQAAITSTMMAMASLEAVVRSSFSGVFMVHKKEGTGKTLFRDKFQSTFQHLPHWMIGEVDVSKGFSSESAILDFDPGDTKAQKGRDISEFRLLSAEDSMTVNGRTPTWSLFDEAQNIPTFQTVKAEIDPTMYQFNKAKGRFELVRQAFAWGTGSSNNTGQGAFENDFKSLLAAWEGGEDTAGWVPVFMDWTCRPGMNREFYLKQRAKYLRGQTEETKGLSTTERLSLFCAHYPSKPDDAFMTSHKTLVPMEIIVRQQNRIQNECHKKGLAPTPGRFKPIWDESVKLPEGSHFPHPVKGVVWEPSKADDLDAPVKMFLEPDNSFAYRYFQGTDPIQNDGGFSRFSSAIWDSAAKEVGSGENSVYVPTVACILNARTSFPVDLFLQSVLMGMYYRNQGQKACRELVEINVGHRYTDFKSSPVFNLRESILLRNELLPKYRGGNHIYGVDMKGGKGSRKESLYGDVTDLIRTHGHNIWYYDFWSQVRNISVESKADGSVVWGTMNKNVYNDDMVYAVAYAELCCRCINKQPVHLTAETKQYKTKRLLKRGPNLMPYYTTEKVELRYR